MRWFVSLQNGLCLLSSATGAPQAGLLISGINAEVMPGQWEFQIGPVGPLEVGDQVCLHHHCHVGPVHMSRCDALWSTPPPPGINFMSPASMQRMRS